MHTFVYELAEISQDTPVKILPDMGFDSVTTHLEEEFPNASFKIPGGCLLLEGHDKCMVLLSIIFQSASGLPSSLPMSLGTNLMEKITAHYLTIPKDKASGNHESIVLLCMLMPIFRI